MAEEYYRNNRNLAEAEAQSHVEVEKSVRSLKQENFELSEKIGRASCRERVSPYV